MFKLVGFVAGVSLSVLLVLGLADEKALTVLRETGEGLVARLHEGLAEHLANPPGRAAEPSPGPPAPRGIPGESGATPVAAPSPRPPPVQPAPTEVAEPSPAVESPVPETGDPAGGTAQRWQVVWTPFRSELSARGFARHLEEVTGREYRVTPEPPWRYRVEFAYLDEEDRRSALALIALATGQAVEQP